MTLFLLSSSVRPVQLVAKGDGPTLLINRDIVNSVLYGPREITAQNYNAYSVIDALGSITVDGDSDIYAIPLAGSPTVDVVQGAANWTPSPALVAAQINTLGLAKDATLATTNANTSTTASNTATTASNVNTVNSTLGTPAQRLDVQGLTVGGNPGGVPLLRDTINLANSTALALPANAATTLLSNTVIATPSFEGVFSFWMPATTGTIPFAVITMTWQDSFTGLQVGRKAYVVPFGNGSTNAVTVYISGPVRGNQLTLTVSNRDPAQAGSMTYAFNLTSHLYLFDKLLQPLYPATSPNGFAQGGGNPSKGLLFASSPAVGAGAGTTVTRMTAASNAKCKFSLDLGGAPNGLNITISTPSSTPLYDEVAAGEVLYRINGTAGAGTTIELQMPNGPLNINMINQGAAGVNPNVTLTAMEY